MYVQLMRMMMTTNSIRPHHVAHTLITTCIDPSCPEDRNWLLCCHENFWRAIKDKTKWYPSNKEQPPSVTVLWQHCSGGVVTGMVRLKRWPSCNSVSNRTNEHLCCNLFYDILIIEGVATTLFRNVGIRLPIDAASYARRNGSSWTPIPCGLYSHPTDTLCAHGVGLVCGSGIWWTSNAYGGNTTCTCNFVRQSLFQNMQFESPRKIRTILIDNWCINKFYNGIMILGAG